MILDYKSVIMSGNYIPPYAGKRQGYASPRYTGISVLKEAGLKSETRKLVIFFLRHVYFGGSEEGSRTTTGSLKISV